MPAQFDLIITADYPSRGAEFILRDASGIQLAYRQTDFNTVSVSHQQGLFDLRNYLRLYVAEGNESAAVSEIGVCIAEEVLGPEIFGLLWASASQRTLRIQLPRATEDGNHLPPRWPACRGKFLSRTQRPRPWASATCWFAWFTTDRPRPRSRSN